MNSGNLCEVENRGVLRSCFVCSLSLFLLSALCSSACGPESASSPRKPPASPAATAKPATTLSSRQAPSSGISNESQPPSVPATSVPKERSRRDSRKRSIKSFAVYGLSRGTGVPPEARDALRQVRKLVETDQNRGLSVSVETIRIGIEGETRVCFDYNDPRDGTRAYERASVIVEGVDLVNLVAEPCATPIPQTETQKQEEES